MITIEKTPDGHLIVQLIVRGKRIVFYTGPNKLTGDSVQAVLDDETPLFFYNSTLIRLPDYYAAAVVILTNNQQRLLGTNQFFQTDIDYLKLLIQSQAFACYHSQFNFNAINSKEDIFQAFSNIKANPAKDFVAKYEYHLLCLKAIETQFDIIAATENFRKPSREVERLTLSHYAVPYYRPHQMSRAAQKGLDLFYSYRQTLDDSLEAINNAGKLDDLLLWLPKIHEAVYLPKIDAYNTLDATYQKEESNHVGKKIEFEKLTEENELRRIFNHQGKRERDPFSVIANPSYLKDKQSKSTLPSLLGMEIPEPKSKIEIKLDHHLDELAEQISLVNTFMEEHNISTHKTYHFDQLK